MRVVVVSLMIVGIGLHHDGWSTRSEWVSADADVIYIFSDLIH
jgi:hypothetical protein